VALYDAVADHCGRRTPYLDYAAEVTLTDEQAGRHAVLGFRSQAGSIVARSITVDETTYASLSVLATVFMNMLHNIDNLGRVFYIV